MRNWALALLVFFGPGCASIMLPPDQIGGSSQHVEQSVADADVSPRLISLLDDGKFKPVDQGLENVKLITPEGIRLKFHYRDLRIPLAQGLAASQDPKVLQRLVEVARWTASPLSRAEALITLATFKDPAHVKYFHEALLDHDLAIQFAAIEAMQISGLPDFLPILMSAADNNWSPIVQVYSAQAALRLGEPRGRDKLLAFLTNDNWVVRAMAARYLGDLGQAQDAEVLLSRIGPENQNPYVLAEVCIAAIKLGALRGPASATPPPAVVKAASSPAIARSNAVMELEPLVVSAPRLRMGTFAPVDVRIDNGLTQLLDKMVNSPFEVEKVSQAEKADLNNLISPAGFALKLRYDNLSYLLAEGLSGTRDLTLVNRLEDLAQRSPDDNVRALALISIAYTPDANNFSLFQNALRDASVTVRFAAVEGLNVLGGTQAQGSLANVANNDTSNILQVYAADSLARMGDGQGRGLLLRFMNDQNWLVRAMAIRALGGLGQSDDYYTISSRLNTESNDFVVAESCYAMLRLAAK